MPLHGPFAPMLPELDRFLFASVGEEVNGMPLSVLSALSRLGLDPRGEAARLSRLAGEAAGDQLARTIAQLPDRGWTSSETRKIAGGLIELLPRAMTRGTDDVGAGRVNRKFGIRPSPLLIVLALAGALLIGLVAQHGSLSSDGHQQAPQAGSEMRSPASAR